MSFLLSNRATNTLQTLSKQTWSRMLSLARFYGWQPMGTLPPQTHHLRKPAYEHGTKNSWDGTYLRNEGQIVRAEDALLLAMALELSLDDIPDVNPERGGASSNAQDEPTPLGILPFEYFAGDGKQNLADFIRFCTLGEFIIL
ncbi:MAG TPA: hypothetical protein VFQ23_19480 [Anaerolineales bacterium]|nr:hypothetical protein [Anaerolineales bacterium]